MPARVRVRAGASKDKPSRARNAACRVRRGIRPELKTGVLCVGPTPKTPSPRTECNPRALDLRRRARFQGRCSPYRGGLSLSAPFAGYSLARYSLPRYSWGQLLLGQLLLGQLLLGQLLLGQLLLGQLLLGGVHHCSERERSEHAKNNGGDEAHRKSRDQHAQSHSQSHEMPPSTLTDAPRDAAIASLAPLSHPSNHQVLRQVAAQLPFSIENVAKLPARRIATLCGSTETPSNHDKSLR